MTGGFFDIHAQVKARPGAQPTPAAAQALTITQLTTKIDGALRAGLPSTLLIRGEVSNFTLHRASGHLYFTLKDDKACIDCVMFAREASSLKFTPKDGTEILCAGRIAVYGARGRYQFYASRIDPIGQGALELAFRQLKEKLEREGLFARERKKPIPEFPTRIALVTSRETAALQDMLKVFREFPWLRLSLYHVPVQGEGAAAKIAVALDDLNRNASRLGIELVLLARGGGSLEDLWQFNEESVARAISRSTLPIVTGIGHEVDVSIADLIADYHAHTPTEAARVVTSHWKSARDALTQSTLRLSRGLRGKLNDARNQLTAIERHPIFRRPMDRIDALKQLLDDRQRALASVLTHRAKRESDRLSRFAARLAERHPRVLLRIGRSELNNLTIHLNRAMKSSLQKQEQRLTSSSKLLEAIGPLNVLKRGYTLTRDKKTGKVIHNASELTGGESIVTRFHDGERESVVEDPKQPKLF